MEKIKKLIKTKEDFNRLLKVLIDRVKNNEPISENPMLDGYVIALIVSKEKFTIDLFLENNIGRVLDGTLQQLEHIAIWTSKNDAVICDIYKKALKESI